MLFSEIMSKLTGISCPVFGVSWNPSVSQRTVARKIITYLEGKRVLYEDLNDEFACSCVESVLEIKDFLTNQISDVKENSELETYVRGMRTACNTFLSKCHLERENKCAYCHAGTIENMMFTIALGRLRASFGVMIGQIAKAFGVDVEDSLAQIIPD